MSRVKEFSMRELQDEFELQLSHREWLRDSYYEPTDKEIQQMEQDFKKPSFVFSSSSISNNLYYDNPKGA